MRVTTFCRLISEIFQLRSGNEIVKVQLAMPFLYCSNNRYTRLLERTCDISML